MMRKKLAGEEQSQSGAENPAYLYFLGAPEYSIGDTLNPDQQACGE